MKKLIVFRNLFLLFACLISYQKAISQDELPSYVTPIEFEPAFFIAEGYTLSSIEADSLENRIENYEGFTIDFNAINNYVRSFEHFAIFNLSIGGREWEITIQEHDLRSPNWYASVIGEDLNELIFRSEEDVVTTFKGYANNNKDNFVRLSISTEKIQGYIFDADAGVFHYIEPLFNYLTTNVNRYIIYTNQNLLGSGGTCGSHFLTGGRINANMQNKRELCQLLTVEIATDADFLYQNRFTNVQSALNYINETINEVEGLYAYTFNINFIVPFQNVYTTQNTPYTSNNGQILGNQVRNHWQNNMQHIHRDVAFLWTGRRVFDATGGEIYGAAWEGVICTAPELSYGYLAQGSQATMTRYQVFAHEIGHILGGEHLEPLLGIDPGTGICAGFGPIMCTNHQPDGGFLFSSISNYNIMEWVKRNHFCMTPERTPSVQDGWEKNYGHPTNRDRIGTWIYKASDKRLIGDFKGNGKEQILHIATNGWATLEEFNCGEWDGVWSNMGSGRIETWYMQVGDKHFAGDFTGDGKTDILSVSPQGQWVTLHKFENGKFHGVWSNLGNSKIGDWFITPADRYLVGDFTNDGKDNLFSISQSNALMRLKTFTGNGWTSNWANQTLYHLPSWGTVQNNDVFVSGDFLGFGYQQLFAGQRNGYWAGVIHFINNDWHPVWTNLGTGGIAGWGNPLGATDFILAGKIASISLIMGKSF